VSSNLFGDKNAVEKDATVYWSNMDVALKDMGPAKSPVSSAPASSVSPSTTSAAAVTITSTPQGAVISIDGNYAGNTPSDLQLMPGSHTLKIELKGYETWEHTINVEAGETRRFSAELAKSEK
jgi:hypothetical protein